MVWKVLWSSVLLSVVVSYSSVQAQQPTEIKTEVEFGFVYGWAQGSFGDNIDRLMPGVLLSVGGRTPNLPLVLSTELGGLNYGFDDHLELLLPGDTGNSTSVFNVEANNSILMAHLVGKFVPFQGRLMPYFSGLVGFKYLTAEVNAESQALFGDNNDIVIIGDNRIRTSSNFDAFTMSYGIGAGINLLLLTGKLGVYNSSADLSLHLGVRYLFGTEADYLAKNPILSTIEGIRIEQAESDTDIVFPQIGLKLGL